MKIILKIFFLQLKVDPRLEKVEEKNSFSKMKNVFFLKEKH